MRTRTSDCSPNLSWLLDPLEHNPWPHHATISGASLGITRDGLLPRWASSSCPPGRGQSADCLAFAPRCENSLLSDCPRDHVGSDKWARAGGRRGHSAIRSREPEAFCDEALEPFRTAFARASWRGRLRRLHGAGRLALDQDMGGRSWNLSRTRSRTSSRCPHLALHGALSRIEARCLRGDC